MSLAPVPYFTSAGDLYCVASLLLRGLWGLWGSIGFTVQSLVWNMSHSSPLSASGNLNRDTPRGAYEPLPNDVSVGTECSANPPTPSDIGRYTSFLVSRSLAMLRVALVFVIRLPCSG